MVFKTYYHLMQVKSIAECSKGSILQYFLPSLSNHLFLRSLFCLFLSGRLRQVLLNTLPGTFYSLSETSCCIDLVIAVDMSYSMTSEKCSCLREFLAALVERLVFTFSICHPLEFAWLDILQALKY